MLRGLPRRHGTYCSRRRDTPRQEQIPRSTDDIRCFSRRVRGLNGKLYVIVFNIYLLTIIIRNISTISIITEMTVLLKLTNDFLLYSFPISV